MSNVAEEQEFKEETVSEAVISAQQDVVNESPETQDVDSFSVEVVDDEQHSIRSFMKVTLLDFIMSLSIGSGSSNNTLLVDRNTYAKGNVIFLVQISI